MVKKIKKPKTTYIYHLVSAVNSGWKAVPSMFPCLTATITLLSSSAFSCHVQNYNVTRYSMGEKDQDINYDKVD